MFTTHHSLNVLVGVVRIVCLSSCIALVDESSMAAVVPSVTLGEASATAGEDSVAAPEASDDEVLDVTPCGSTQVCVDVAQDLGAVLIATRSFRPYETLFEEDPLLLYDSYDKLVREFNAASQQVKLKVLDLFHSPFNSEKNFTHKLRDIAKNISVDQKLKFDDVYKLLAISDANSHVIDLDVKEYQLSLLPDSGLHRQEKGLFAMASRMAHSCLPNCLWTTVSGKFRCWAVRPIARGEQVTISYINKLFRPIDQRRLQLSRTRDFLCCCLRCIKEDDCRCFRCYRNCTGYICPLYGTEPEMLTWHCSSCSVAAQNMTVLLDAEVKLQRKLKDLEIMCYEIQSCLTFDPNLLEQLAFQTSSELSPTHYLNIQIWQQQRNLCILSAGEIENMLMTNPGAQNPFATPSQLRQQAASAGIRAASIRECIAAGCHAGVGCKTQHPACPEMYGNVFCVGNDLMAMGITECRTIIGKGRLVEWVKFVNKYVGYMIVSWGPHDADVHELIKFNAKALEANYGVQPQLLALKPEDNLVEHFLQGLFALAFLILTLVGLNEFNSFQMPAWGLQEPLTQK